MASSIPPNNGQFRPAAFNNTPQPAFHEAPQHAFNNAPQPAFNKAPQGFGYPRPMGGAPVTGVLPQGFVANPVPMPQYKKPTHMGGGKDSLRPHDYTEEDSPSKTSAPEATEDSSSSGVTEVELNTHGGLCRLLWYLTLRDSRLIRENEDKQERLDGLTSCVLRWTFFPMIFQTIFLIFLAKENFEEFPRDDQVHDGWIRMVTVFAIAVYIWSMTNFFFNDILRQHRILAGAAKILRCDSLFIGWTLYIWEILIFIALIVLGSCFLAKSETATDAILNALALEFILGIDNYVAEFVVATGGILTAYVPTPTVLPESNSEWRGCSRVWVCLALNLVFIPILPIVIGWVACLAMDKGLVEVDDVPVDAIIFGILLFLMIINSYPCLTYCCCCFYNAMCCNVRKPLYEDSEEMYGLQVINTLKNGNQL